MNEKFVSIFNREHELGLDDGDTDYFVSDKTNLNKVIIDSYEKAIDDFVFEVYLLKFSDHTFIDADENFNLIKNEIPVTYQVNMIVTLKTDKVYTINNVAVIKSSNINKSNSDFINIKNIIEAYQLEELINYIEHNLNKRKNA
jgi:hypothetical protein